MVAAILEVALAPTGLFLSTTVICNTNTPDNVRLWSSVSQNKCLHGVIWMLLLHRPLFYGQHIHVNGLLVVSCPTKMHL